MIAARIVAGETFHCARCDEPIRPDDEWDLDHTADRTGYLGPSHSVCNRRAGSKTETVFFEKNGKRSPARFSEFSPAPAGNVWEG